jgi:hypothetical protein
MELKYNNTTLKNLQQLFKESEYSVRYERGQFKSGYCIIHNKKIIVINKFFDIKGKIESFLDILSQVSLQETMLTERSKNFLVVVAKSYEAKNLVA